MRVYLDPTDRMPKPATLDEALAQIRALRATLGYRTAALDYLLKTVDSIPRLPEMLASSKMMANLEGSMSAEDEHLHMTADGFPHADEKLVQFVDKIGRVRSPTWAEAVKRGLVKDEPEPEGP